MPRQMPRPKPKIQNPGKLFKRLMSTIFKYYKVQIIIVMLLILLSVAANIQGTLFIQRLIDDYIVPLVNAKEKDYTPLLGAISRVAVFYVIGIVSTYTFNKIMIYVAQGTIKRVRDELFEHMQDLPIKYFDTHSHGDIMSVYTNDVDTLRQMISQSMPQMFNSSITVIGVTAGMIYMSIPLTIVTFVMVGVTLFVTKTFSKFSAKYFISQQKDLGAVNGFIEEMVNGQKVVKVFNH